ncbi:MAG: D-xylose ABC transporter ATP-binding protein [Verrucomicrobia bacterium]|nr:MAG: D-xylose ABC transporter ATP-binding protein [Verrucomicrobiota bacterium]
MIALCMQNVSKRFGPVQALADVTFQARSGTVHALCGENGAGKSTLMKILAGVYRPDAGQIELDGKPCRLDSPAEALAAGVSMIYQELDLAEDLSVAENIFLGAEPRGRFPFTLDRSALFSRSMALAKEYGFSIHPQAMVGRLSVGDCQIVELLKALRRRASIIVMDEPTSSLTEAEARRLFSVVRHLRERGLTVVYISHRLEEVVGLADDITVLRDGRVVHSGPASAITVAAIVHHMVGRELKDLFPAKERGHSCPQQAGAEENEKRTSTASSVQGLLRTRMSALRDACPTPRVQVRDLASSEGIQGISFEIAPGEIVGMAGLVGSGRTEVARALFGVTPKSSGDLWLDGEPVQLESPADAIRSGMALLTEDRKRTGLCLELPCCWNITLPNLDTLGMAWVVQPAREAAAAASAAARVSIKWASPYAPANSLSGGNQQKLLVVRWLLGEARFMIFDEPTRGIDVGAKREIYGLLRSLAAQGKAILFISSELPELFGMADRILVMRRGRMVGNLATDKTSPDEVMHLAAVSAGT